jgi:hypothetical protein
MSALAVVTLEFETDATVTLSLDVTQATQTEITDSVPSKQAPTPPACTRCFGTRAGDD